MALCNTFPTMARQSDLTSLRLSDEFREAARSLAELHGAKNQSDYFRGLIYLDAVLASAETDMLDKPAWVTRSYGKLIRHIVDFLKEELRQRVLDRQRSASAEATLPKKQKTA